MSLLGRALVASAALSVTSAASASIMTVDLSTHSSDETDAGLLLASIDYSVAGNTLTISVTNNTSGLNSYNISEVWFNFGGGVTSVAEDVLPTDWTFQSAMSVDGMGIFDFGATDGVGGDPSLIMPGETEVFSFTFTGAGSEKDFTTAFSDELFIAAAKFIQGPGDDSAWGGTRVPAPGVLALLGLAGFVGTRRRRRG